MSAKKSANVFNGRNNAMRRNGDTGCLIYRHSVAQTQKTPREVVQQSIRVEHGRS